jgi:hypothetical protein
MGVNFHVEAAIIEPGLDAAALLQRIGRVARGDQSGVVHVCKPQREVSHFIKLQQAKNPVNQLRDMFGDLRKVNTRMAKELGRAYWSMLRRQNRSLMDGMEEAFVELMGEGVSVPGKLLDSLWIATKLDFRCLPRCFRVLPRRKIQAAGMCLVSSRRQNRPDVRLDIAEP